MAWVHHLQHISKNLLDNAKLAIKYDQIIDSSGQVVALTVVARTNGYHTNT